MIESVEEFVRLRSSEMMDEYWRAAHEEAPVEIWMQVVERFPEYRFWVAQNKTVPLQVLERLAHDTDTRVRSMVASKRKLSPDLQRLLSKDADASVRQRLAYNAKCAVDVLRLLSNDLDPDVRDAASRKLKERENAS